MAREEVSCKTPEAGCLRKQTRATVLGMLCPHASNTQMGYSPLQ